MKTTHLSSSYILHTRSFKETSLLVEAFTETHGRVSLLARGAKRPKGRWRGLLQPFIGLSLSWIASQDSDLFVLGGVENNPVSHPLPGKCLLYGFYINELMMRLTTRGDPAPTLYHLYEKTLTQLKDECNVEPVLRAFELGLLSALGYAIDLFQDAKTGHPIERDSVYGYDANLGLFALDTLPEDPYPILVTVAGASILALQSGIYSNSAQLKDAKRLLRAALGSHLGNKPLKSREIAKRLTLKEKRHASK